MSPTPTLTVGLIRKEDTGATFDMKCIVLIILGVHLTCVLSLDFEREAREAETKTVDVEHLYTHNEAFRNITKSGVPSKRVVGVLSAAGVGFKLLSGVASQVDLSRVCVVGFSNMGNRKLVNPEWYLSHGVLREPLPREILPGDGGVFIFEKTHYATFGTAGVFTYAIENSGYQVAVMWDVPMIYGPSSNMFNVHVSIKRICYYLYLDPGSQNCVCQ
ncbi:bryoporin-like isoform X2 [Mizuhopecten yessoensis]|uniref:bryoporin-like isoform X2 n=1 Tax=Mizuhopecten yessoensis TaxID=6573 RepID=UPI000B45F0C5|nr:bryoporin-like isoform X2 [Mizuhopecten yessoensis]